MLRKSREQVISEAGMVLSDIAVETGARALKVSPRKFMEYVLGVDTPKIGDVRVLAELARCTEYRVLDSVLNVSKLKKEREGKNNSLDYELILDKYSDEVYD